MRIDMLVLWCMSAVPSAFAQTTFEMGSSPSQVMAAKITVSDLRKSYNFYTNVIGFKDVDSPALPKPVIDDTSAVFSHLALNFSASAMDPFLCLIKKKGVLPTKEQAGLMWVVIKTTDVRATTDRVRASGFPVETEPKAFMGAVVSVVRDPDGYMLELFELQHTKAHVKQ